MNAAAPLSMDETDGRIVQAAILSQVHDAIITVDAQLNVVFFNHGAEVLFGRPAEQVMHRSIEILVPESIRAKHAASMRAFFEGPGDPCRMGPRPLIFGRRSNDEPFEAHASLTRTTVDGKTYATAVIRDVTKERRLEDRVRASQQLEAMGRLAAGVAHDFGNLVSAFAGRLFLAEQKLARGQPIQEELDTLNRLVDSAGGLIRQLLLFSRPQPAAPRRLEINHVVRRLEKLLSRLVPQNVTLTTELGADAGAVEIEPTQLEQGVVNLVVNACDAMPNGGTLTICTSTGRVSEDASDPHLDPGTYTCLSVRDTGVGIAEELRERILEPFFSTKSDPGHSGLGLATVLSAVQRAGGHLDVHSEPGHGSEFSIRLPRCDPDDPNARSEGSRTGLPMGSERILFAEDNEAVRLTVSATLRQLGYQVVEARNAGEALLLLERDADAIDLLLADVVMPIVDGVELARRARALRGELPVLLLTGRPGPDLESFPVIAKPVEPATLARAIHQTLAER
jgi:PAS domain S-box-containing protein